MAICWSSIILGTIFCVRASPTHIQKVLSKMIKDQPFQILHLDRVFLSHIQNSPPVSVSLSSLLIAIRPPIWSFTWITMAIEATCLGLLNPVTTGPSWWSPPPRRCSHLYHLLILFLFLRLPRSQAMWKIKDIYLYP